MSTDDSVALYQMWRETMTRLDALERRVDEGQDVVAAVAFARYVHWSGLPRFLERHEKELPLKIDAAALRDRARALEVKCCQLMERDPGTGKIHETQLEAINRKLDLIAGHVATISPVNGHTAIADAPKAPALLVMAPGDRKKRVERGAKRRA